MNNDEAATILEGIASLLESGGENGYASLVRDALSGSQQKLEEFLRSNTLWGGSGSIADSSFPGSTGRSAQRRELEKLLIQLGRMQAHQKFEMSVLPTIQTNRVDVN